MVLTLYELAWRPAAALIRRTDAQVAHDRLLTLLRHADDTVLVPSLAKLAHRAAFRGQPTDVGGVRLPQPIVIAAGLVKGEGFPDEAAALAAVDQRRNVVAGWRALPALVGAVEFGSFTRQPRLGNPGRVVWRDHATRSMQNRIGLRNPGARAAAAHLRAHADALPPVWGINQRGSRFLRGGLPGWHGWHDRHLWRGRHFWRGRHDRHLWGGRHFWRGRHDRHLWGGRHFWRSGRGRRRRAGLADAEPLLPQHGG